MPMPDSPLPVADVFWTRMARVAVLSIVIGLALEGLLLLTRAATSHAPGWSVIAAECVQKVSWSSLVCLALASAQSLQQSVEGALGLAGFLAAPSALLVARALHRASTQALGASVADSGESIVLAAA